jgi:hypothetical protein
MLHANIMANARNVERKFWRIKFANMLMGTTSQSHTTAPICANNAMRKNMANKYNARKVKIDGYLFDSRREAERYSELRIMEKAGEIKDLIVHPKIELQPGFNYKDKRIKAINYIADFQYYDEHDNIIIEDVKGVETQAFRIKWKMLQYKFRGLSAIEFRKVL